MHALAGPVALELVTASERAERSWDDVPDDPFFQLTFPQPDMLAPADFGTMIDLVARGASKAAIRNHSKSVALYAARQGWKIRSNSVHPAAVLTPMWEALIGDGPDREARMAAMVADTPLKRFGTVEEVAALCVYLASPESAYMTGAELTLDGGLLAYRPFEGLDLALAHVGVDALDLDVEQLLDRLLDLRLGRVARDFEHHLVTLGAERRLFGDDGRNNHVVVARISAHLNRASSASTAARVSTSFSRRRMS